MTEEKGTVSIRIPGPVFYLLILHAVIFLVTDKEINSGDLSVIENWALCWRDFEEGRYVGVITYMFLHSGIGHFANNMLMLYVVGAITESALSSVKFVIIYFTSGIAGGFVSAIYYYRIGKIVYSAGASAAVFGIIGAAAAVIFKNKEYEGISTKKIICLAALSIYGGFTAENIDNAGHIGGLLAGFIVTMLLYRGNKLHNE